MTRKYKKGTYILVPEKNRIKGIGTNPQAVYLWLCHFRNNNTNECWPSIKTLEKLCGSSRGTVRKGLRILEEKNLIKKQQRKNTHNGENDSNLYRIIIKDSIEGGSNTDLPTPNNDQPVGHIMTSNYTQRELKQNNSSFFYSNLSSLRNIPEVDISNLINKHGVPRSFILEKAKDVEIYCNKTGKVYKNYKYALQGFIEKDLEKNGRPKRSGEMKKISDLLPPIKIRDP